MKMEWPKRISDIASHTASMAYLHGAGEHIQPDDLPATRDDTEVIPASLGREMYEMLKDARFAFTPNSRLREVVDEVLARYEAEVGR